MSATSRLLVIAVVGVAAIVAVSSWQGLGVADLKHLGTPRNSLKVGEGEVTIPHPEGPANRLIPVVQATPSGGSFEFLFDGGDAGPTRYDPCRKVSWVLSPEGMPSGALPLLEAAADRISAATGLVLDYEGTTSEKADFDRDLIQDAYGDRFAPVVVGWSTASQNPDLAGAVTGVGGSSAVNGAYGDQRFLHAGVIILDSDDMATLMAAPTGDGLAESIVMHEWGHVLGLAHINDASELMNASNSTLTSWGPGDLEGLAIAGAGPCEAD
jgi:hypothetical protein